MSERTPQSEMPRSEDRLTRSLRQLGAASTHGAPPELGERLAQNFRQHHQRRRRTRWMAVSAMAACLCMAVAYLLIAKNPTTTIALKNPPATAAPANGNATHILGQGDGFLALTIFDPGTEMEDLRLMRVEMPGSALRLVGAPVSEELAGQRITADLIVGQDGTPYAIRLVR